MPIPVPRMPDEIEEALAMDGRMDGSQVRAPPDFWPFRVNRILDESLARVRLRNSVRLLRTC